MYRNFIKRSLHSSVNGQGSFIATAKAKGLQSIVGKFAHENRFDQCLKNLQILELEPNTGKAKASIFVEDHLCNSYGTLHGGAISTLIDVGGSLALLTKDNARAGVTVDMHINFMSAAKKDEKLIMDARVLKYGKRLGFTEITLIREKDNKIIAHGTHTKAL